MTPPWLIPGLVGYGAGLVAAILIRQLARDAPTEYTIVAGDLRVLHPGPIDPGENTVVAAGIRCNKCGLTSWSPMDVASRYCSNCHVFHDDEARRTADLASQENI